MKVLLATPLFPPQIGGPATYASLLARELPRQGIEVVVQSFGDVLRLPKGIRHVLYVLKLLQASKGADVVFAQDPVSSGFPALVAARVLRRPLILRIAGDYAWEQSTQRYGVREGIDEFQETSYGLRVTLLRSLQRFVAQQAEQVITPSEYFKRVVYGWGVPEKRINVIYNGVVIPNQFESRASARKGLGLSPEKHIIFSAGRLVPWKGFDGLLDIVGELQNKGVSVELRIAGDGPDRARLEQLIEEKGLGDSVYLLGSLSQEQIVRYLRASDVFALKTAFESFSFQTVEAMAYGLPVVVSDIGNLREIVREGEGILVSLGDQSAWVLALSALLSDSNKREEYISRGRERSLNFSISKTVKGVIDVIASL